MKSRSQLLKINSLSSLSYQIVSLICGFILPKLIIENYGSSINGLLSSISQFLGFIALCELGMGAVVPASLYKPLANNDEYGISKVVVSCERFYKKIAIGMLIYIGFLMGLYPLLVNTYSFVFTASLILIIASSSFAQYFFGITYSLLLSADQKQYISNILNSTTIVLNLIISYFLIEIGCSIHIVKLCSAVIFVFRPIFYNLYVKKNYRINHSIVYSVEPIKQKWNGVAQHIAYTIQEKSGVLILTALSTLEIVSVYSIYYLVLEGLRGLIYSVTSSFTSFMGNIIAKDESDTLKTSFSLFEWLIHTVTVLCFTSCAVVIIPFMKIYTQEMTDMNYIMPVFAYIMCAAIGSRCLQMPYNIVVQAAGHFKETQNSAIIEPIINVIISVALVPYFGIIGVAIGMLVSMVYRMLYLSLYLTHNIIQSSRLELLKRLCVDLLMIVAIVFISLFVSVNTLTFYTWFIFGVEIFVLATIITVLFNLCFYKAEMQSLINIFKLRFFNPQNSHK